MIAATTRPFGALLREYRLRAGLTQEVLAERAGLSVEAVQALERGRRSAPRLDTVARLAAALGGDDLSRLVAAARPDPVTNTPPAGGHNLPATLAGLIGRERERARVAALLDGGPLVTLIGAGGIGKTRLALAVAEGLVDSYPDGVRLVELAALANPVLIPDAVAAALALRPEASRPLLATLTDYLRTRHLLLVLDNCEHLVTACAELVATLLRACPHLHILATSREALKVMAERRFRVPALSAPPARRLAALELVERYEAVQLFVARAREHEPGFTLDAQNAGTVAEICTRLDGIPLAIELAAARVGALPVATIAERLDDRFRLLTHGARTVLPRQRTLRAALDWSWDLLAPAEQQMLARLAVFAGGRTVAAVQAICADTGTDEWDVLDVLSALVDKSLLNLDEQAGEPGDARYRMLETVRQYGQERLAERGEAAAVRDLHLQWYAAFAAEADPALQGPEQTQWLARLDYEHDNIRTALSWSINRPTADPALRLVTGARLAGALRRFWRVRSYLSEGLYWLTLVRESGDLPPAVRAKVLQGIGFLTHYQGNYAPAAESATESLALYRGLHDTAGIANTQILLVLIAELQDEYAQAKVLVEECLALFRDLGDRRGESIALYSLGQVERDQGNYEQASRYFSESCALCRSLGDSWGMLVALNRHSVAKLEQGDLEQATALANESLVLGRDLLKDTWSTAWALCNLSHVAILQGQFPRARALAEESLALNRQIGAEWGTAIATSALALLAHEQGDYPTAIRLYQQCLSFHREVPNKWRIAECLEALARAAVAATAPGETVGLEAAAQLFGAAASLRSAIGAPRPPAAQPAFDHAVLALRGALGESAIGRAWAAGASLSWQEAAALALSMTI